MADLRERQAMRNHPEVRQILEGMSNNQLDTAAMMLTAKVDGKLVRRYGELGSFEYPEEKGRFAMVTIAQNPEHDFVGAANLADPELPLLKYFVNLRGGTPQNYELMASVIAEREFPFKFDYITGIPTTGNYIAKPLAKLLGVPYFEILEKPTDGVDRKFVAKEFKEGEGPMPGMKALLVDDLITKAKTKFEAEQELIDAGFEIAGHAVVLDRQEGGAREMKIAAKKLVSGITGAQLFAVALVSALVSEAIYRKIMENITKLNR